MIKIVIDDDNVHMISSQGERHINFSNILSLSESKNLIVLSCKGDMTITLTKNGFIEGTSKECIDFFYKKLMKNTIK